MERLTEYIGDSPGIDTRKLQFYCDVGGYIVGDIARRLAAYEDKIPFDRLDEVATLVKARDEGQVMVLPCKVGETLYTESPVKGMITSFEAPDLVWIIENISEFGKTVFLTRAEAEAAIGGGGDG